MRPQAISPPNVKVDIMKLESFVRGKWASPGTEITEIRSAVSGDVVAQTTGGGLDMREVLAYAREVGGKNLAE
jgi:oxepin-CoA hydrolase/3-oxo-5,6-dehydrosuberyl-CoA semialdehyde dehydrogenase